MRHRPSAEHHPHPTRARDEAIPLTTVALKDSAVPHDAIVVGAGIDGLVTVGDTGVQVRPLRRDRSRLPDLTALPGAQDAPSIDPAPAAQVLLVHDQTLVRAGLRALLDRAEGVAVVAETASGGEALALARRHRPQVVVMEAGPEALRTIGELLDEEHLGVGMLVLTASASDEDVWSVLRAGAPGFLREDADLDELGQAVRAVARGETFLSRSLTRRLIAEFVSGPNATRARPERLAALTAREREVMALVAAGLSNEEIARRLICSPATAKTHVSRTMRKLGARDRAQLVGLAYETGLVSVGARAATDADAVRGAALESRGRTLRGAPSQRGGCVGGSRGPFERPGLHRGGLRRLVAR
jgi:DNA-binding NarL/FixJ family response regulator